ncbi:MAG: RNA-binding protein [Coxiellaceae bacterium]|nr:RNA-binding protein [Coxiellaceae bacterium]
MNSKIFIGNLPWSVGDDALRETFGQYGSILECVVIKERDGRSKGYGFVTYTIPNAAEAAIKEMNGAEYCGRCINVNEAMSKHRPILTESESTSGSGGAAAAA